MLQMANLKENIELEVQSAHEEFLKLQSNVELYITEMEKAM